MTETAKLARDAAHSLLVAPNTGVELRDALQLLTKSTDGLSNCNCQFEYHQDASDMRPFVATNLYRIAQEAVANSLKHGGGSKIIVTLDGSNRADTLTVRDHGLGFQPHPDSVGLGLHIMKYRASLIGGKLYIGNAEDGGTVVRCQVERPQSR